MFIYFNDHEIQLYAVIAHKLIIFATDFKLLIISSKNPSTDFAWTLDCQSHPKFTDRVKHMAVLEGIIDV